MPPIRRKYNFKSDTSNFHCKIACTQCRGKTRLGSQCKHKTCFDRLCHQHLRKNMYVKIAPSTIEGAGFGLFAVWHKTLPHPKKQYLNREIPIFIKGDEISYMGGEWVSATEIQTRYPGNDTLAPYTIQLANVADSSKIDSACIRDAGSMANSQKGAKSWNLNNAEISFRNTREDEMENANQVKSWLSGAYQDKKKKWHVLFLRCIRPIYHGDEIFVDYGTNYWEESSSSSSSSHHSDHAHDSDPDWSASE